MVRAILTALLLAAPTVAEAGASSWSNDALTVRDSSEGHAAEVYYSNSADMDSSPADRVETHNDIVLRLRIELGVDERGRERITVEPQSPGLIAHPPFADVLDGESVVIQVMRAMF